MSWYRKNLGDALLADAAMDQVRCRFVAEAGLTSEAAIFYRHESAGLHCELVLYFSPAAATVAQATGAKCCTRPATQGLALLAGGVGS
jgi:hypothetical protein